MYNISSKFSRVLTLFIIILTISLVKDVICTNNKVYAENRITLESLQKQAFKNRDIVKKYLNEVDIKKEIVKQRKGAFMPSIDIDYSVNLLNHDTIMGETKENDTFQSAVSWNAFAGFYDYYRLKSAEIMTRYSIEMVESTRQDIALNAALRFLEVYTALENLKTAENEIKLYNDRLRQIELKFKVGVLKKNDVLKVKVERDNAVQTRRKIEASVETTLNQLAKECGISTNYDSNTSDEKSGKNKQQINKTNPLMLNDLDFSIFKQLPEKKDYDKLEPMLINNRSDLTALQYNLKSSEMGVQASKSSLYPKADLSLSYSSHTKDDFFIKSMENSGDEVRCQAAVSMNLFDGMQKYSKIKEAELEKKNIEHDIIELQNSLKTALKNSIINTEVAFDNLEVAVSGTKEAEENLRVTDLGFEQGIITSSDVLDSIYNLSRAKFNEINARTEIFANEFQIKRLVESF